MCVCVFFMHLVEDNLCRPESEGIFFWTFYSFAFDTEIFIPPRIGVHVREEVGIYFLLAVLALCVGNPSPLSSGMVLQLPSHTRFLLRCVCVCFCDSFFDPLVHLSAPTSESVSQLVQPDSNLPMW